MAKIFISWVWQPEFDGKISLRVWYGNEIRTIEPENGKYIWNVPKIEDSIRKDRGLGRGVLTLLSINVLPES